MNDNKQTPIWQAWKDYIKTDNYKNALSMCGDRTKEEGALWAAFERGFYSCQETFNNDHLTDLQHLRTHYNQAFTSLSSIYIAVPETIAEDINIKVKSALLTQQNTINELLNTIETLALAVHNDVDQYSDRLEEAMCIAEEKFEDLGDKIEYD